MIKIGVVCPVLSNLEGALKALESLKTKHVWQPFIAPQWVRNKPISRVWNEGASFFFDRGFDAVLVINDDILFCPFTVDNLVEEWDHHAENARDVILLSACNNRDFINNAGGVDKFPDPGVTGDFNEHPDFSCFMFDERLPNLIGKFDENFIPAYFEDNDTHVRVKKAGYRAGSTCSAPYYHYASQTVKPPEFHAMFDANRNYFVRKWGAMPSDNFNDFYNTPFNDPNKTVKDW